jgi:hypothetical protein
MNVVTRAASTALTVFTKERFQFFQQIGAGTEMAEIKISPAHLFRHGVFHPLAVVAVKCIPFDKGGGYAFAAKNLFKRSPYGRGARTRGAGYRDDGMFN